MAPTTAQIDAAPESYRAFLSSGKTGRVGDDVFWYAGYFTPEKSSSLWVLKFFSGPEFMVFLLNEEEREQEHSTTRES